MLIIKIILTFIIFFFYKNVFSEECKINDEINVGVINDKFIDYSPYLYYELDKYSFKNSLNFNLRYVKNDPDEFDIIFGDYSELKKLSLYDVKFPDKISQFYENNKISLSHNLFPLDLDTFIILSRNNIEFKNFEELSEYYDPLNYTFGLSLESNSYSNKFITYLIGYEDFKLNNLSTEIFLNSMEKSYRNLKKNILKADHDIIFNSYENSENLYTMFDDGILLYKNVKYKTFQLLPKAKYKWNKDKGIFNSNSPNDATSFFGFSAYLNNQNHSGFICHLINEDARLNAFQNFNIQISPLSSKEVENIIEDIPVKYLEILKSKTDNIIEIDNNDSSMSTNTLIDIIINKKAYIDVLKERSYLN